MPTFKKILVFRKMAAILNFRIFSKNTKLLVSPTLKTLDKSEVVNRLVLVRLEFCAKIVHHLVSTTRFCVTDITNGNQILWTLF